MKNTCRLLYRFPLIVIALLVTSACEEEGEDVSWITIGPGDRAQSEIQKAFIEAESGTEIRLEAGTYELTSQLSIDDKRNIHIRGAGRDKTILSFKDQNSCGEGLLINQCTEVLLEVHMGRGLRRNFCTYFFSRFILTLAVGPTMMGTFSTSTFAASRPYISSVDRLSFFMARYPEMISLSKLEISLSAEAHE